MGWNPATHAIIKINASKKIAFRPTNEEEGGVASSAGRTSRLIVEDDVLTLTTAGLGAA